MPCLLEQVDLPLSIRFLLCYTNSHIWADQSTLHWQSYLQKWLESAESLQKKERIIVFIPALHHSLCSLHLFISPEKQPPRSSTQLLQLRLPNCSKQCQKLGAAVQELWEVWVTELFRADVSFWHKFWSQNSFLRMQWTIWLYLKQKGNEETKLLALL